MWVCAGPLCSARIHSRRLLQLQSFASCRANSTMPRSGLGSGDSTPLLHRSGIAGALARFSQRTYAADYIALGFLVAGWVLVRRGLGMHPIFANMDLLHRFNYLSTLSIACSRSITSLFNSHSPFMNVFPYYGPLYTLGSSPSSSYSRGPP